MIRRTTVSLVMLLNYAYSTAKFTLNRTGLEPDPKCLVGMAVNDDRMFQATVLNRLKEVKSSQ
jgi:ribosomal protein L20